jgi:hypothetical protein
VVFRSPPADLRTQCTTNGRGGYHRRAGDE